VWAFGDGTTATGPTASHAYAAAGTYPVTLSVFDGYATTTASTTATVTNRAPIANAGPDASAQQKTTVSLDGRASADPDGTIVAWAWRQLSGPAVTLTGRTTSLAGFTAPKVTGKNIVLSFELEVTDDDGATATDAVTVTVTR
jgi:PKD repeat protein